MMLMRACYLLRQLTWGNRNYPRRQPGEYAEMDLKPYSISKLGGREAGREGGRTGGREGSSLPQPGSEDQAPEWNISFNFITFHECAAGQK